MYCSHVDTTTVQEFTNNRLERIRVEECDYCGRILQFVDEALHFNYPNTSYLRLA